MERRLHGSVFPGRDPSALNELISKVEVLNEPKDSRGVI